MLTAKEAAKQVGVSIPCLSGLQAPDQRIPSPTGGFPRLLYKQSTITALIKKRVRQKKRNIQRQIERELLVPRPTPEHLTLTEAAQYLGGIKKAAIRHHVRGITIMRGTHSHHFYLPEDLVRMGTNAKPKPKGKAGRTVRLRCSECGVFFNGKAGVTKCLECQGFADPDDLWGVKVKQRKRSKPCPICGGVLFFGQILCSSCRKDRPLGECADGFEYCAAEV